ncbi:MAG TPA: hypothetical protein VGD74_11285, partial [Vulgatibacter sp.]
GFAFASARLSEKDASILHATAGGQAIDSDGEGRWLFVADGWSWQERAEGVRAVLAGETIRVQAAAGGESVLHAIRPNATYWLESERLPVDGGEDPDDGGEDPDGTGDEPGGGD